MDEVFADASDGFFSQRLGSAVEIARLVAEGEVRTHLLVKATETFGRVFGESLDFRPGHVLFGPQAGFRFNQATGKRCSLTRRGPVGCRRRYRPWQGRSGAITAEG